MLLLLCGSGYWEECSLLCREVVIAEFFRWACVSVCIISYHISYRRYRIISYHINHIISLKWQNHLKVGTDKSKLKVKMQPVSDDDVQKRLLEKPRFDWWRTRCTRYFCCGCIWCRYGIMSWHSGWKLSALKFHEMNGKNSKFWCGKYALR